MRIKRLFIFLLGLSCGIVYAQTIKFTIAKKLHSSSEKVNIYIDRSGSMRGFFEVGAGADKERHIVHTLFSRISDKIPNGVVYYGFDTVADTVPLPEQKTTKLAESNTFNAQYNVYSSALESLNNLMKGSKDISVLITDGVPSLTSGKSGLIGGELNRALASEYEEIKSYMREFLLMDSCNRIVIYRYYPLFNGVYYPSDDKAFKGASAWKRQRNLYAVVFAKEEQLQYVDELFFDKKATKALDVKKMSPSLYSSIMGVNYSLVEYKDNKANFSITLEMKDESYADLVQKAVYVENGQKQKINIQSEIKENKLILKFAIPEKNYSPKQTYQIIGGNALSSGITSFKELNIELDPSRGQTHERDVFRNDESFHSKTFRLSYLINPIIDLQEEISGFVLTFTLAENSRSWVSYFEPMFGAIKPRASIEEINNQLAPLWMFLYRWIIPVLVALIVFYFFLNFKIGRITNPKLQKTLWWVGFIMVFIIVFSATAYYVFSVYVGNQTPSLGYQLKHLIYNPIFALLVYWILSLVLTRRTWCTACNEPIPF